MKQTINLQSLSSLKQTLHRSYKPFLLALALGCIYPLGFSPIAIWPLTLISMAGFFWLLQNLKKQYFMLGFAFGVGQFGVGTSWIYVSVHEFGHASVPLALFITLLFVLYLSLYPAMFSFLYGKWFKKSKGWNSIIAIALLWLTVDGLRGWVFSGFPWLYAGYAFIDSSLANWAPIAGVHGISLLSVITSALVIKLLTNWQEYRYGFAISLIWLSSFLLEFIDWSEPVAEPVTVTLVQPNIEQNLKWQKGYLKTTLDILKQLTEKATGDIVIWPEGAVPAFEDQLRGYLQPMVIRASKNGQKIVSGIPLRNADKSRYFNGVVVLTETEQEPKQKYFKRRLVPFGEYVPLQNILRGVIKFFNLPMSAFSLGPDEQPSLTVNKLSLGMAICYEIAYPELVYAQAEQSSVLLTVSNDAWFGSSWGPYQHMEMARMRALETALPLLRATNNGITAIVDEKGKIFSQLEQNIRANLEGTVQPRKSFSWVLRYNSWWFLVILLGVILMILKSSQAEIKES